MRVRLSRAPVATAALLCGVVMLLPFARSGVGYATSHLSIVSRAAVPSACQSDLTSASQGAVVACLRQQVKYVFVLYQENRSFDSYFSTFPGAQGIYSQPASQTPGYYQTITNTDGTAATIQPFRIGPSQFAADTDDIDHSHGRIDAKMDVTNGVPQMDKFASVEEQKYTTAATPSLLAKQYGELSMAYEDCDTVPLLWNYAKNFTLMDNIYQQMTGPSTPGNLAIIGAQSGQTQQIRHPDQAVVGTGDSYANPGVPVLNDICPPWGSSADPYKGTTGIPFNSIRECSAKSTPPFQTNLTYASLPVSLAGPNALKTFNDTNDLGAGSDIADLNASVVSGTQTLSDTGVVAANNPQEIPWGWYQEGYHNALDPTSTVDPSNVPGTGNVPLASYIVHHNGPQYFGYIANNQIENRHLHSLTDFFSALTPSAAPPATGGVYYVKGGYYNFLGSNNTQLKPADPSPLAQRNFPGDDDHPAYSDAQISEALVAHEVNTIASSQYWPNSAIIITWDDSEGDYDHLQPPVENNGPSATGFIADGPRVPFMLISPFSKQQVVHTPGDHGSVVKFVDTLFNLVPLANLPAEYQARQAASQPNYGPDDSLTPEISNLVDAFDPAKLDGAAQPLASSLATVPAGFNLFPTQEGQGCQEVGITPAQPLAGESAVVPLDFNPRPSTEPGTTAVTKTVTVTGARLTGVGANGRATSLQSLYILPGTVRTPTAIGVTGVISGAAAPDVSGATTAVGDLLQLRIAGAGASNQGQRRFPALLRLSYAPSALPAGVLAGSLAVYRFDPLTNRYTRVVSQDNGQGSVLAVITTNVPPRDYFELRGHA